MFTTHTARFLLAMTSSLCGWWKNISLNYWPQLGLSRDEFIQLASHTQPWGETFSMPVLALRLSEYANGVSKLHGQVSRKMWQFLWPEKQVDEVPISYITNGVHNGSWLARPHRRSVRKISGL